MPRLSRGIVQQYLDEGDRSQSSAGKGRALEALICYMFECVPGVTVQFRNITDQANAQEIDVGLWNEQHRRGLFGFPSIILVECKNWAAAVSTDEVGWFDRKLRDRGQDFGVLVAANGITGNPDRLTSSHQIISDALKERREIVVVTRDDIVSIVDTSGLVTLLKQKRCMLAALRTSLL